MADEETSTSSSGAVLQVEVVYAEATQYYEFCIQMPEGSTIQDAIDECGIKEQLPGLSLAAGVGVYGQVRRLSHRLSDGDRVEIYRPLKLDPREARRLRAAGELE